MTRVEEEREMFMPYCEADFIYAVGILEDAEIEDTLFDLISAFCRDTDTLMYNVDPCGIAMEAVLNEARSDIEDFCGIDICNDIDVCVYSNYIDTCLQYSEDDVETLEEALRVGSEDNPNYQLGKPAILVLDEMEITF